MDNVTVAEDEIEQLDRVILATENWAKHYSKTPDIHAKLIKAEAKLARQLRKYFRDLGKERVAKYINWGLYHQEAIKAYNLNVVVDVKEIIDKEGTELLSILHDPLQLTMALGANGAAEILNLDLGMNQYHEAIMRATSDYVGDLVKGITDTTKDRIKNSVEQSIRLHESTDEAQARLTDIMGDPARADMISRTETVRAYNKGITTFGKESGATSKIWEISSDPCPICEQNEKEEVGINEDFSSGDSEAPAHPNCRCGTSLNKVFNNDETDTGE